MNLSTDSQYEDDDENWSSVVVESVGLQDAVMPRTSSIRCIKPEGILRSQENEDLGELSPIEPEGVLGSNRMSRRDSWSLGLIELDTETIEKIEESPWPVKFCRPNVLLTVSILERIRQANMQSGTFKPSASLGDIMEAKSRTNSNMKNKFRYNKSLMSLVSDRNQFVAIGSSTNKGGDNRLNSISNDSQERDTQEVAAEIDMVISGGGMKCYFATGAMDVLKHAIGNHNIQIARFAGASAGAWAGE